MKDKVPITPEQFNNFHLQQKIKGYIKEFIETIFKDIKKDIEHSENVEKDKIIIKMEEKIDQLGRKIDNKAKPFKLEDVLFDVIIPSIPVINIAGGGIIKSFAAVAKIGVGNTQSPLKAFFVATTVDIMKGLGKFSQKKVVDGLRFGSSDNTDFSGTFETKMKIIIDSLFPQFDRINDLLPDNLNTQSYSDWLEMLKAPEVPPEISELVKAFHDAMAEVLDDFIGNVYNISKDGPTITPLTLGLVGYGDIKAIINIMDNQAFHLGKRLRDWIDSITATTWLYMICIFIEKLDDHYQLDRKKGYYSEGSFIYKAINEFIRAYRITGMFDGHLLYLDEGGGIVIPHLSNPADDTFNMLNDYEKYFIQSKIFTIWEWKKFRLHFDEALPEFVMNNTYKKSIQFEVVQNENDKTLYYAITQRIYYTTGPDLVTDENTGEIPEEREINTNILLARIDFNKKSERKLINKLIHKVITSKYENSFRKIPSTTKINKIVYDEPHLKMYLTDEVIPMFKNRT